jgi:hypothetical protein
MLLRLNVAGSHVAAKIRTNVGSFGGASLAGQFPHLQTGALQRSIFHNLETVAKRVVIGSDAKESGFLEFGTSTSRVLTAQPGRFFSWIDPVTGRRVFTRRITIKPMAARPFVKRTFLEESPTVLKIMTARLTSSEMSPLKT